MVGSGLFWIHGAINLTGQKTRRSAPLTPPQKKSSARVKLQEYLARMESQERHKHEESDGCC